MDTKERLNIFIESLGINKNQFEIKCGLSTGAVNNIRKSLGTGSLGKIKAVAVGIIR